MVRDVGRLSKKYVLSSKFVTDILAILPLDVFYIWLGVKAYLRLNRLIKVWRFSEFFDMAETHTSFPNVIRISNVLLYIMILIHWFGCLYFGVSNILGFGSDSWVYPDITLPEYSMFWKQYSDSFLWATLTLTTIGDTEPPLKPIEVWFVVTCSLLGVLIFATVFGNVGAMIKNLDGDRIKFQHKVDSVKKYMELRGIGPDLQERVIKWFDYTWKNKQSVDDKESLKLFPEKLRAEISIHVHMETLRKVAILQDCEPGLLVELVVKLKLQVYSPGDFICKKGDIGREMYIVKRGKLQVISEDGKKVYVTLTEGAVFGEISVLHIVGNKTGNRRTASVKTLGFADLYCLTKQDFWSALQDYPGSMKMLLEKGKQLLRKDNLLDEEAEERAERKSVDMAEKVERIRDSIDDIKETNVKLTKRVDQMSDQVSVVQEIKDSIEAVNKRLSMVSDQVSAMSDLRDSIQNMLVSRARTSSELRLERSPSKRHRKDHLTTSRTTSRVDQIEEEDGEQATRSESTEKKIQSTCCDLM